MPLVPPERVRAVVEPVVAADGLELVDLQVGPGLLRVFVEAPGGGVDTDHLGALSGRISEALDRYDPMPGSYALEVSSPGVERPLRTPEHFRRFVGSRVAVKTVAAFAGDRRLEGRIEEAGAASVTVLTDPGASVEVPYDQIERARTVFEWPAAPPPGRRPKPGGAPRKPAPRGPSGQEKTR